MSHGDAVSVGARRVRRHRHDRRRRRRRLRGPGARAGRRAVPPRGAAHRARPAGARALPLRRRRAASRPGRWPTSSTSRSSRSARRSAASASSAGSPAASTPRSPRRWCSARSATSSPACSSTTGCCARARPSRSSATSSPRPASRLKVVDAPKRFLDALAGVTDPEDKRKAIGREFIRVFEAGRPRGRRRRRRARRGGRVPGAGHALSRRRRVRRRRPGRANIKSHHNVGGLPDDLQFALVEPLRTLFKDEVRAVGLELGLPAAIVWRQPFPGPGLGIRIIGEVTARAARRPARGRRDRPRGADRGRARPRHLAVPGRAARRRALGRRRRATGAPTATRSCCVRCRPRTR